MLRGISIGIRVSTLARLPYDQNAASNAAHSIRIVSSAERSGNAAGFSSTKVTPKLPESPLSSIVTISM